MKYILILILLLPLTTFSEENCKPVNLLNFNWIKAKNVLRKIQGVGPKSLNMPALDQGGTGTCYAFAGVQLLDYWRQSRGIQVAEEIELGSAIYMALIYQLTNKQYRDLEGGWMKATIEAVRKYGFCSQNNVNNAIRKFMGNESLQTLSYGEHQSIINDDLILAELTSGFISKVVAEEGASSKEVTYEAFRDFIRSSNRYKIRKMKESTIKLFYDKLQIYAKNQEGNKFIKSVLATCFKNKMTPSFFKYLPKVRDFKSKYDRGSTQYANHMGQILRTYLNYERPPAVGITYCSSILKNPGYRGFKTNSIDKYCRMHASIIIGKRPDPKNPSKCQFLLKNTRNRKEICDTWGGCITRKVKDSSSNKYYKEEVGLWIDEKELMINTHSFTYIYPEKTTEVKHQLIMDGAQKVANKFVIQMFENLRKSSGEKPRFPQNDKKTFQCEDVTLNTEYCRNKKRNKINAKTCDFLHKQCQKERPRESGVNYKLLLERSTDFDDCFFRIWNSVTCNKPKKIEQAHMPTCTVLLNRCIKKHN